MKRATMFVIVTLIVLGLAPGFALAGPAGQPAVAPAGGPQGTALTAPQQGPLIIPQGQDIVKVDGFCNPDLEYNDALATTFSDYGGSTGRLYLKHTPTDLYVCVVGAVGPNANRFFRVYLDRDNGREPWAEADDLGLQVNITTGIRGVVKGTGSGNYTAGSAFGWSAAASTDNLDMGEYRIPLRLTNGWCDNSFGLAVYHHWLAYTGDDYGWPSNQWYDQPQTWIEVRLGNPPCQIPVYRLPQPTVNPTTTMELAGLLEGLGGQEVLTDTSHAGTTRLNVVNEGSRAALQQLTPSAGFFAFNADEAWGHRARGPFDLDNARMLACDFLMGNELFPWEQTPADAMDCDNPAALPYEVITINLAGQSSSVFGPTVVSPTVQTAVIVKVPLGINVGDFYTPHFVPLTGPGGHLSLLFTTTDPQSNAWSLDDSVPGLAALAEPWHGRTLELLGYFPIIGRDQAIQQLQRQFPERTLNPGQPELAYFVGDPAVPQSLLLPVWTFPGATVADEGGNIIALRTSTVPAVPGLLPTVVVTSPPDGTLFTPGQPVTLNGELSGGTPPYTYTWSLEDGTVLGQGVSAGGNVVLSTVLPAVNRDHVAIPIAVYLSGVDSLGAGAEDHVILQAASIPTIFLPVVMRGSASGALASTPEGGIQATYRVGVEWVSLYNGLARDLGGTPPDGNGLYNALRNYGWGHGVRWTNNAAWERDWRDCSLGGGDCSYGMDRAEFAYFAGHGSPARISFGTTRDASNFWGGNARFQTIKWAAFASCQTLHNTRIGDWFNAFQGGARVLLGFHSDMNDIAFGAPLVDNMRIPTFFFVEMPWLQRTIPQAWVQTAFNMNAGLPAYLYVTGHGVDTSLDKLPKNGDPALPSPYPFAWYIWVWWE